MSSVLRSAYNNSVHRVLQCLPLRYAEVDGLVVVDFVLRERHALNPSAGVMVRFHSARFALLMLSDVFFVRGRSAGGAGRQEDDK